MKSMDVLFEQRIVQNSALAAECLWHAVHEAYECSSRVQGVAFPLTFLVLPLVFHQRTAKGLYTRTRPAAVLKALKDDREITVGLQKRVESLSDRTFEALSLAFSGGLVKYSADSGHQLFPGIKTPPVKHVTEEVKIIHGAAKRVGQMFVEMRDEQICATLKVDF